MTEQNFDVDALVHHQVLGDGQTSDSHTEHSERREKRKRSPDSQSDTSEEPEAKRARKSPSPSDSADQIVAPWPSIGYSPRPIEPNPLQESINEMYRRTLLLDEQCASDTPPAPAQKSPSPSPNDSSDTWRLREYNPRPIEPNWLEQLYIRSHTNAMRFDAECEVYAEYNDVRPSTPETCRLQSPPSSPAVPRPRMRTSLDTPEEPEIKPARTSPSESPEPILPKWPRTWSPPPPRKSAYDLRREYDADAWPARPVSPSRLGKLKRLLDAQSDASEESETKRTRTSSSESPEPAIDDNAEETNWLSQWLIRTSTGLVPLDELMGDASADHQNPLPAPRTDDGDAAESDERGPPAVDSIQARPSAPKASRLRSRQRPRKRDTVPPQRKRQPPKEGKGQNKRNKRRDEVLSPVVETFLRSKRSSRRDPNCKLWQLGDDGTSCTVSRVR